MNVVKIEDENEIHLTSRGHEIIQGSEEATVRALCEAFIGFYDTMAVLDAAPVKVGVLRNYLIQVYEIDWTTNTQSKKRIDWLRNLGLAKLEASKQTYHLTAEGQEIYNRISKDFGKPPVAELFISDRASSEGAGVGSDSIVDTAGDAAEETLTAGGNDHGVGADADVKRPEIVQEGEPRVYSYKVSESNNTVDRYQRSVEVDIDTDNVGSMPTDELKGNKLRVWGVSEEEFRELENLTRGDILCFFKQDRLDKIAVVLMYHDIDVPVLANDWAILFEEVYEPSIGADRIQKYSDVSNHPLNSWVEYDRSRIKEEFGSLDSFFDEATGELEYDYWDVENWDLTPDIAAKLSRQLERKGQVIIYGPPGTGKTFHAERFARWWTGKQEKTAPTQFQTESVTFHPTYSYEDFVEGYTIVNGENNDTRGGATSDTSEGNPKAQSPYGLDSGIFREFCEHAESVEDETPASGVSPRFLFLIDELNRGNVPQIFGENITIIEKDKRGIERPLSHSGDSFSIPPNVYVIATMNTADQSISRLDAAIRRRFAAVHAPPNYDILYRVNDKAYPGSRNQALEIVQGGNEVDALERLMAASVLALEAINSLLVEIPSLSKGKRIGHAYLLPEAWRPGDKSTTTSERALTDVWQYDILPLLEEYFFDDVEALERHLFDGQAEFIDTASKDIRHLEPDLLRENLERFVQSHSDVLPIDSEIE